LSSTGCGFAFSSSVATSTNAGRGLGFPLQPPRPQQAGEGPIGCPGGAALSPDRVLNPGKKNPRDSGPESLDVSAMTMMPDTSCERVHLTLTVALLLACAANVALVCAWL